MTEPECKLTPDQLQGFLQRGESDTVEFKTRIREPAILARIIAGFANNRGGTIFIGIHELQGVVGTNTKLARSVLGATMHWLQPQPEVTYHETEFAGKSVAVIFVKASTQLVFCRGQVFRRTGERTLTMKVSVISAKLAAPLADNIAIALATLTETVEKLRQELAETNTFKSKMKDYLIGGVIGAVLGFLLSLLLLIF
ncbi:MAG: ATP-binding protein [SAR324 cluster bacterium]|nr:ATP-binding protein [SAR324 cluster bacterium]